MKLVSHASCQPILESELSNSSGFTPGRLISTVEAMQRDVERIEELYRLFRKRDIKSILMLMAQDVEITQSTELPWGGTYHGHDGVKEFLGKLVEHLDNRIEIERLIDAGEHVVAIGRTVGKARATNLEFDVPVVHVWTLHEGQITRFQPYIENGTMLAALGI